MPKRQSSQAVGTLTGIIAAAPYIGDIKANDVSERILKRPYVNDFVNKYINDFINKYKNELLNEFIKNAVKN